MTPLETFFEIGVPGIMLLILISFLFKDWPGWRWLEHMIIGCAAGVLVTTNYTSIRTMAIVPAMGGNYLNLIPIILGLLLYARFIPAYRWVARYGFLWIVAGGCGLIIGGTLQGNIIPQMIASGTIVGATAFDTVNNFLVFVVFLTTFSYFIFTKEQKGALGVSARLGRIFMMIGFGLAFSALITTYFAVILERVYWLMTQVFGLAL